MDIICRWRDAITDPPPDGWHGVYRYNDGETICMSHGLHHGGSWWTELEYQDSRTPDPGDQWLDVTDEPAVAVARVQAELEAERMRLAACSVAALSNTRESAKAARVIPDEYKSASWYDVCAAVDREMDLRESTDAIPRAQVQAAVDEIAERETTARRYCEEDARYALTMSMCILEDHTGVTPTEVDHGN